MAAYRCIHASPPIVVLHKCNIGRSRVDMKRTEKRYPATDEHITLPDGSVMARALTYRGKPPVSQEQCDIYLEMLAAYGNRGKAAEAAGSHRVTFWRLRQENELFAKSEAQAAKIGSEYLEEVAVKQAVEGIEEPIYYKGDRIDTLRRFPGNNLLQFLLKANNPEKFKDRQEITTADATDKPPHIIKNEQDARVLRKMLKLELAADLGNDENDDNDFLP